MFFLSLFLLFVFSRQYLFAIMDHIEQLANLKHQLSIEIHKLETAEEDKEQVRDAAILTPRLMNCMIRSVEWKKKWKIR